MTTPSRPVAAASIETEWGQAVHDYTFAPAGFEAVGNAVTVTTTVTAIPIDGATQDPGGWLDLTANTATVPTDRAGLYLVMARLDSSVGVNGDQVRGYIRRNGGEITRNVEDSETGGTVILTMQTIASFTAGDIVTVHARKVGSGANPSVLLSRFFMIRIGDVIGA
jgi:hypothetical protein